MKNKLYLIIGFICVFISFNSLNNKAFSQQKCLLVLDIQEFPIKDKQLERLVKEMIQNTNSVISHFDSENVIYIKAAGRALSITSKGFSVDTLPAPGFDNSLNVVNNNIYLKIEGDAFTSVELLRFLESRNAKEIVLVGLMAEKCIYNTALGGKERGYNIMIVPEAIVGTTTKKKEKAIKKLKDKGIEFIPLAEIVKAQKF